MFLIPWYTQPVLKRYILTKGTNQDFFYCTSLQKTISLFMAKDLVARYSDFSFFRLISRKLLFLIVMDIL